MLISGFAFVQWVFYSLVSVASLIFKYMCPVSEHSVKQDVFTGVGGYYTEMRRIGKIVDSLLGRLLRE